MNNKYSLINQFERFTNEHGFELDQDIVEYLSLVSQETVREFVASFRKLLTRADLTIEECFSWITA